MFFSSPSRSLFAGDASPVPDDTSEDEIWECLLVVAGCVRGPEPEVEDEEDPAKWDREVWGVTRKRGSAGG